MKKSQLFLSTIDENAFSLAKEYGIGVEIAAFCTAANISPEAVAKVRKEKGALPCTFHGAFNELFPCAIDPEARKLAAFRFRQAGELARDFSAQKLILHGGYVPRMYYPIWYVEQSILFWKAFLKENPDMPTICLENVLEGTPDMLLEIVKGVDDPRLRLCLDIGHANVYSRIPAGQWVSDWLPYLSHAHIHNNDGSLDAHGSLGEGTMPIAELISMMEAVPNPMTYTLELIQIGNSIEWLQNKELLL